MASGSAPTEMGQESECSICHQHLINSRILDCGHSFCQGCITIYCETWGTMEDLECPVCKFQFQKGNFCQNWQQANLGDKIQPLPLSSRNEGICLRHKGKLHLFCKEDEKLVCFVCGRFPEHEGHALLLLEEAAPRYKGRFHGCLEILRKEKVEILAFKADVEKESQDLLNVTKSERQKALAEFRKLHQFLEEQEEVLLAEIEETEKEIARKRDVHLARFAAELSSLESLIQEVEEKIQQTDRELLQDVRNTLQRYERTKFENLAAFPSELKWRTWGFCNIPPLLEGVAKKCKASLVSGLHLQKAKVTLDPASNSCCLVRLSEGQKKVMRKSTAQDLSKDPEKHYGFVLGREGFTAGCHFWEVVVGFGEGWAVGVARKLVKGRVTLTPEEGIWAVGRWEGGYKAFLKGIDPPLTLRRRLLRVRVCLNYDGGRVAFFDARRSALLYEFSGASFCGETLHPFFAVYGDGCLGLFP